MSKAGRPARPSVGERVAARLREQHDVTLATSIASTRAGHWQRAQGAWSWVAVASNGQPVNVGSQYAGTDLLRCKAWRVTRSSAFQLSDDQHVDPCAACEREPGRRCTGTAQVVRLDENAPAPSDLFDRYADDEDSA